MSDLLVALREAAGAEAVITGADTEPFVTDWRGVYHGEARAVVRPSSTAAVSAIVRLCAAMGTAIVPQGGNTGLAAGATPLGLANVIVVNMSRMRTIRQIDAEGNTIAVDAGCVLADVQDAALRAGRFFPLSLASEGSAQIGGLIATNAGGTAVLRYGTMRALVLGLETVLPDGSVLEGMRALRKDNAGYDWKQLFIGSEGTLGVITGAVLRLFPTQAHRATALVAVESLAQAVSLYSFVQSELGDTLTACEFFGDLPVGLRLEYEPTLTFPMPRAPFYVLFEAASSIAGLSGAFESSLELALANGIAIDCVVASGTSQANALWEWRESITETERRTGPSVKHDVSVPISSIAAFMAQAQERIARFDSACRINAFGHLGDGNVHFNVLIDAENSVAVESVNAAVHESVRRYSGSITAEHGIGRYRRTELPHQRSGAEMDMMRAIKTALDPRGIMNPGAVL